MIPEHDTEATAGKNATQVLVDAHVHIHECFVIDSFLSAAAQNFAHAASRMADADDRHFVMCLTETAGTHKFAELHSIAGDKKLPVAVPGSRWTIMLTDEPVSLIAEHPDFGALFIVSGRQIVTRERLEVLALGTTQEWPDGSSVPDTVHGVTEDSSLAVIPWGFGKWWGRRGKIVEAALPECKSAAFFLGDNSGRPRYSLEPRLFAKARAEGIRILPGTDPLPFPAEHNRAGKFGFRILHSLPRRTPWLSLRKQLVDERADVTPYGALESPARFLRNQIAMQWLMRRPGEGRLQ